MKITKSQLKRIIKEELQNVLEESMWSGNGPVAEPASIDDETLEEEMFAPNHYCVHHGGVQMEGKIKLGKAISHNWNEKLQKVTKYDMQLEDGTIVKGVKAEDLLVTEASLAEMHGGKRDDGHSPVKKDEEEELEEECGRC